MLSRRRLAVVRRLVRTRRTWQRSLPRNPPPPQEHLQQEEEITVAENAGFFGQTRKNVDTKTERQILLQNAKVRNSNL